MTVIKKINAGKNTLEIVQDGFADSPREWDNLGTILYSHRRYNVGDETFNTDLYDSWEEALRGEVGSQKEIIALPVYMYEHSVIVLSTKSFVGRALHAEWDSGQVGWIYVTKERVRKEYGVKRISAKLREKVENVLRGEIETFSNYTNGEVYGFVITDEEGEHVDSCYGFYGDDWENNGMVEHLPSDLAEVLISA